jgi:hypothetical protein
MRSATRSTNSTGSIVHSVCSIRTDKKNEFAHVEKSNIHTRRLPVDKQKVGGSTYRDRGMS